MGNCVMIKIISALLLSIVLSGCYSYYGNEYHEDRQPYKGYNNDCSYRHRCGHCNSCKKRCPNCNKEETELGKPAKLNESSFAK